MHTLSRRLAMIGFVVACAASTARAQYVQTNIVSDIQGMAPVTDSNLKNPWGISFSSGSPFWVSDQASNRNGSSVATLYTVTATNPGSVNGLIVNIPTIGNVPPDPVGQTNGPTGQVTPSAPGITTNAMTDFQLSPTAPSQANFIFANLDGSISAWRGGLSGTQATIQTMVSGASFTGLAIGNTMAGAPQLYAADQNSPNVDVFNSKWVNTGSFTDKDLPKGFTAFNVQNIAGNLYVTFANQANPLGGFVDEFSTDGTLIRRLVSDAIGQHLDQPWGVAIAPSTFGQFAGDLLVGNNNGDGWINAYNLTTNEFAGFLTIQGGQPFHEGDLWALTFGNGGSGGLQNTLYFTAGLDSQTDGLFGAITSVPEPSSYLLGLAAVASLGLWIAGARALKHRCRLGAQA